MSYLRFNLDVAIKQPIPETLKNKLPIIRSHVRDLKSYASKINEGTPNEEMTVKATYHVCRHDEGLPCDEETEI